MSSAYDASSLQAQRGNPEILHDSCIKYNDVYVSILKIVYTWLYIDIF